MSKVVSGIGKAVGGIVKGVKKAFKAVTKSKIGKALMFAAAIYLGGAALGAWESPFSMINGALSSQATPAAAELAGAASGGGSIAEATLAGAGATGETAGLVAGAAETAGAVAGASPAAAEIVAASQAGGSGLIEGAIGGISGNAAPVAAEFVGGASGGGSLAGLGGSTGATSVATGPTGLIDKVISGAKSVGSWAQKNPISAAMGLNAVANMSKPDERELLDHRAQKEMELYDWKNKYLSPNWNVGAVNLGFQPGQQQLQYRTSGQPVYGPGGALNVPAKG